MAKPLAPSLPNPQLELHRQIIRRVLLKFTRIMAPLWILMGLGLGYWSVKHAIKTRSFLANATSTQATVIRIQRKADRDYTAYVPILEYRDSTGERHEFIPSVGENPPSHNVGDQIELLYDRRQPVVAQRASFTHLWGFSIFLGLFGLALLFFGTLAIWIPTRQLQRIKELEEKSS